MTSEVLHVKSRCGGGKSRQTILEMYNFLTSSPDETVIFASKTNNLTKQNHNDFETAAKVAAKAQANQSNPLIYKRIDTNTVPSSTTVLEYLHETLDSGFQGVIFVSHEVLTQLDPTKIRHVRLIADEVPAALVKYLFVRYETKDAGKKWEDYLLTQPSGHINYQRVLINPNADTEDILRLIHNVRTGTDNSISQEVADLLEFVLDGHEVTYTTTTSSAQQGNKALNVYQAIDWRALEKITSSVKKFAVLSAQLRGTLVGFVLEHVMQKDIIDGNINPHIQLELQHQHKARIFPILCDGHWSSSLKKRPANEALEFNGKLVSSTEDVIIYAQNIAKRIIQDRKALLILNNKDDVCSDLDTPNIESITTAAHGSNSYSHLDHAIYLASNRPNTYEEKALRMFATDHGLIGNSIMQAVLKERCYETCYQCLARTSIRKPVVQEDKEHIFVVPDMAYAEYVAQWFDGGAVIDTSYSHTKVRNPSAFIKQKKFNTIVQIRSDYHANKGTLKDIIKRYGLSEKTYKRHIDLFRPALEQMGLVKPKRIVKTSRKGAV